MTNIGFLTIEDFPEGWVSASHRLQGRRLDEYLTARAAEIERESGVHMEFITHGGLLAKVLIPDAGYLQLLHNPDRYVSINIDDARFNVPLQTIVQDYFELLKGLTSKK